VIDLSGGWRDRGQSLRWTESTVANLWSTTKCVTSLAVLILVDRGEVDLDALVTRYWPAFGGSGKSEVLVRHLLSHTSGVSGWDQPFQVEDMYDVEAASDRLAAQELWWEPGSGSAYHSSNFGHLNGKIVRQVTGTSLGTFIHEAIARPLGADFYLGLRSPQFDRVAELYPPLGVDIPKLPPAAHLEHPSTVAERTLAGSIGGQVTNPAALANTAEWRRAEIGASNGHANARAVGRILSVVTLGGTAGDVELLSPETVDRIFDIQARGTDMFLETPVVWGVGYAVTDPHSNANGPMPFLKPGGRVCFWGGYGGSFGVMDLDRQVTIAYVPNQMHSGFGNQLRAEYYGAIMAAIGA